MKYIVRKSIEMSIEVTANSEEEAYDIAAKIPDDDWGTEHSEMEVEEG